MRNLLLSILILAAVFSTQTLCSEEVKSLSKYCEIISPTYHVPDNDIKYFADVDFRIGWNKKAPFTVAVQFVNRGYDDKKMKFAIKDLTSKKTVILDVAHKSRFGSELLKSNSISAIWSGTIDKVDDNFSLMVWSPRGDKFVKEPLSIYDQE